MSDLQNLKAALLAIAEAKRRLDAITYENGSYHAIKYSIDGAHDLLLQAQMCVEHAVVDGAKDQYERRGVVARFDEEKPPTPNCRGDNE